MTFNTVPLPLKLCQPGQSYWGVTFDYSGPQFSLVQFIWSIWVQKWLLVDWLVIKLVLLVLAQPNYNFQLIFGAHFLPGRGVQPPPPNGALWSPISLKQIVDFNWSLKRASTVSGLAPKMENRASCQQTRGMGDCFCANPIWGHNWIEQRLFAECVVINLDLFCV